jgi:hypothetical protein
MIRKQIEQWLAAVYQLPIVEDFTQTKVEKSISYSLQGFPVDVSIKSDDKIRFEFDISVMFRCPNGIAGIGFLSTALADLKNRPPDFGLSSPNSSENIEYQSMTEMIISKQLHGFIEIENNRVRELLKCVHFPQGLDCNDGCPTKYDFNQLDFKPLDFA